MESIWCFAEESGRANALADSPTMAGQASADYLTTATNRAILDKGSQGQMQSASIPGLLLFSFVTSITPGPNNLMLAAAGSRIGFLRTWPHMLGIIIGCSPLFLVAGIGLGTVLQEAPEARAALLVVGAGYLLYLACKLWSTARLAAHSCERPIGFLEAASFQLVNPKGWMAIVPAVAAFSDPNADALVEAMIIYAIFETVMLPCIAAWAAVGAAARRFLDDRRRLVLFNRIMAVLTALTAALFLV